jgi:hypothetical protein
MREAACSRPSAVDKCRYRGRRPWTLSCSYQISVARAVGMPQLSPHVASRSARRSATLPWRLAGGPPQSPSAMLKPVAGEAGRFGWNPEVGSEAGQETVVGGTVPSEPGEGRMPTRRRRGPAWCRPGDREGLPREGRRPRPARFRGRDGGWARSRDLRNSRAGRTEADRAAPGRRIAAAPAGAGSGSTPGRARSRTRTAPRWHPSTVGGRAGWPRIESVAGFVRLCPSVWVRAPRRGDGLLGIIRLPPGGFLSGSCDPERRRR